jgi:hypothetical protein
MWTRINFVTIKRQASRLSLTGVRDSPAAMRPFHKEVAMNLLNSKSLIKSVVVASALVASSLALAINSAAAANPPAVHKPPSVQVQHRAAPARIAARRVAPPAPHGFDIGQFIQGMLGGPLPPQYAQIVRNAMAHRSAGGRGTYEPDYESPTYSDPAPVDNSQSQAVIDASDQAMDQSLQDLDASVAAVEQQNDAANAAAQQTEINAGM